MSLLQRIVARAGQQPKRIVFPESGDRRVLRAASRLAGEKIAAPILVGDPERIRDDCSDEGIDPSALPVEDPETSSRRGVLLTSVLGALRGKGVGPEEAATLLRQPLYYAAAMVRSGAAHGTVAGAVHSTSETLRAALRIIRPADGTDVVSSFFLMELRTPTAGGDEVLAFADSGLVPDPDEDQLVEIAQGTAAEFSQLLGRSPKVAFLSFSSKGSADHPSVTKVRRAAEKLKALNPGFPVDGELQVDAALIPEVAREKSPSSPLGGKANVLIFPNLDAGNIGYKLVERLAGAQAIGPLLRGLARPANDLSRGCADDDIVVAAAVTALQVRL